MEKRNKLIALFGASALSALLFGFAFKAFIQNNGLIFWILAGFSAILFLAIAVIVALLVKRPIFGFSVMAVDMAAMLIIFYEHFSLALLISFFVSAALLMFGYSRGQQDLKNNLNLRFIKTAESVLGPASSALAIFAILLYISMINLKDPTAAKQNLEIIAKPSETFVRPYIPNFSLQNSLNQIAAKLLPKELASAPQELKNQFIQESSIRLSEIVGNFTNLSVKSSDRVIDIIYKATIGRLLNLPALQQNLVLFAAGVFLFLLIRFALIFVNWISIGLAFGIYKILLAAGFCKIILQNQPKNVIVLE
ncbi:MAG: hypothetical protein AAB646_01280 [Patescibacteria group bacterium]